MYTKDYKTLLKRLTFAMFFYTFFRLVFYFYNYKYFATAPFFETFYAFIYGLRFDLSTVLISNLFFIIISLLPLPKYKHQALKKIVFFIFNAAFLTIIIGDLEFFSFLGKKMTIDAFSGGMVGDVFDQIFQISYNYWYMTLVILLTYWSLWKYYPRRKKDILLVPYLPWYKVLITSTIFLLLTVIGIRGGLQLKSISPKNAFIHKSYELGNLTVNAAYTLVRSIKGKTVPKVHYFKTDSIAKNVILEKRIFENGYLSGEKKDNVVIILLESFSQEYTDEGYTPFLKELMDKGLSFKHNFANGRRSIEVMSSVMTSIPSIVEMPISQSKFQTNQYFALPKILKENNYQTAFYHGGRRGTMYFDVYSYSIGFEKYFGLEDYPNQDHFDGHWGVYDHQYLKYFADELDKYKSPFFTSIFTLSSHQPYSIPVEFHGKFPKGDLDIHESIGYVDYSLKMFFEYAKTKPWFKNTLFVITADHTSLLKSKKYNNLLGRYRVPLVFFHPEKDLSKFATKKVTQHVDIMPSVLDYLGIEYGKRLYYGTSVFGQDIGRVLNYASGSYIYVKPPYAVRYDGKKSIMFELKDGVLGNVVSDKNSILNEILNELRAYIQYTNNGLRNNNIYSL